MLAAVETQARAFHARRGAGVAVCVSPSEEKIPYGAKQAIKQTGFSFSNQICSREIAYSFETQPVSASESENVKGMRKRAD